MRAIVVEDSRLARDGLCRMLAVFPELIVVGSAANVSDALLLVDEHQPELIFLDIHMPEENGFDLLAQMSYQPKVIFTAAYAEYAIQSFEHNTVDYLLKPISKERLATAVEKLQVAVDDHSTTNIEQNNHVDSAEKKLAIDSKIFVKDGEHCHLISLQEISCIESCKNYVRVYFGQHNVFIKKSLSQVESRLPERAFFRANRQFIINLHFVSQVTENLSDGYDVKLTSGRLIEVSRRNASKMKDLLSL